MSEPDAKSTYPSSLRLSGTVVQAFADIGAAQVPPIDIHQKGILPRLISQVIPWARDVLLGRIHICPDDRAVMREDAGGFVCPQCGGTWRRPG